MIRTSALLAAMLLLTGCASSSTWGWYVINPMTPSGWINVKFLINGMGNTILISLIAAVISIALGLIVALPEGLDTVIGERGVKLSGGQKQRLAIARAFLKNPPILILDEATSALDTQTEREIQASLFELAEGRTTLVIAHRLATIRHADRIVVVAENGIAEQGRHDALLAADGYYRRLHAAQVEESLSTAPRTAAE